MNQTTASPLRKLAAIMFTDIAGFTKAMSADEESTLALLRKKRSILRPLIIENNGTFVKEIGDGTLSYFPSAIDAATCAIHLQQATFDDPDMNLRIGVHVGDIVFDEEDVFGDGVNVAARLESMAPVGGVCVSKSVFEELLNKKEFDGVPLGLQQLKGVGRLIDVFALKADRVKHPDAGEYQKNLVKPHTDDEVPSVAVLPLKNKGKEEDAFYAYGITADLISDLSRAGRIRVAGMDDIETAEVVNLSSSEAAKKLHVRYIVNGMLWKHKNMFQLSIEMNDTKENMIVWSDRWQEQWEELTTIKAKLTESLLKALNLGDSGGTESTQTNTEAYEYYLKAKYKYQMRQNIEDTEIARGLFEKAIDLDDTLLQAKIGLGVSYHETGKYSMAMKIYKKALTLAETLGNKAAIGSALTVIGWIYIEKGEIDRALDCFTRSLAVRKEVGDKKGIGTAVVSMGVIYATRGDFDKALEYYSHSLKISEELDDKQGIEGTLGVLGGLYYRRGQNKKALAYYNQSLAICQELGNKKGIGAFLHNIGNVYKNMSDFDKAFDHFSQSLQIKEELGDLKGIGNSLYSIGGIYYTQGEDEKALDYYTRAIEIYEEVGDIQGVGYTLTVTGLISMRVGNYSKALDYFTRSHDTLNKSGNKEGIAGSKKCLGSYFYEIGEFEKAIEYLEDSMRIQKELDLENNDMLFEINTHLLLAYKQTGQEFDLKEIYTAIKEVENIDYELNFRIFELLEDKSYLETACSQVQEKAKGLEDSEKFLNYPIPKAIVEAWESIEK